MNPQNILYLKVGSWGVYHLASQIFLTQGFPLWKKCLARTFSCGQVPTRNHLDIPRGKSGVKVERCQRTWCLSADFLKALFSGAYKRVICSNRGDIFRGLIGGEGKGPRRKILLAQPTILYVHGHSNPLF